MSKRNDMRNFAFHQRGGLSSFRKANYILVILALCMLWGCSEDEDIISLSVESSIVSYPYSGGTQTLKITANGQWGISDLPDWLSAAIVRGANSQDVTLTAANNPDKEDRTCNIVVYATDGSIEYRVAITQEGMHTCPITVGSKEEIVIGGRPSAPEEVCEIWCNQYINVSCDTEWEIVLPSWLTVVSYDAASQLTSETKLKGSKTIFLTANETNTNDEPRIGTISLKTFSGESSVEIPVRQLGRNEISVSNHTVTMNGFTCSLKSGANVEYIAVIFKQGNQDPSILSYADFEQAIVDGGIIRAGDDGTYIVQYSRINENFHADTDYSVYFIGGDANGYYAPLSNIHQHTFHTLTEAQLLPRVEISDVEYVNGTWHWKVKPNDYTTYYITSAYFKRLFWSDIPSLIELNTLYWYDYYGIQVDMSETEQSFSSTPVDEDVVIIAIPFGKDRKRAVADVYVTDIASVNYRKNN